MNRKIKQNIGILFLLILLTGMIGGILLPDQMLSYTERRKLSQFPELSIESILDTDFSSTLETYLLEQFPGRDLFRTIKAEFDTWFLRKLDSNGYVKIENQLFEIRTSNDESQVVAAAELFEKIVGTYFADAQVYYSVIPDKNMFVNSLPQFNYYNVDLILADTFTSGTSIQVFDTLKLEGYYDTDLHARQECLIPLANALLVGMGVDSEILDLDDYQQVLATDEFYGGYSANSAYLADPDELYYLENDLLQNTVVYDYETDTTGPVYTLDKLDGMDYYDIFLGGARALLTLENPEVENGKKLIIFRDSFGSSISPLLLGAYEEITLVDLRYVSADYAMRLLNVDEQDGVYDDVLFLYQVQVLHNSSSMKQ